MMTGNITTGYITAGYITAGYITIEYVTAGDVTAGNMMTGYLPASWIRKQPYLDTTKTKTTLDYRVLTIESSRRALQLVSHWHCQNTSCGSKQKRKKYI